MMRLLTGGWFMTCIAALVLAPRVVAAQLPETMPIEQVKDCLCQQQQLDTVSSRMKASGDALTQRQQELQQVEDELSTLQRTATPGDAAAIAKSKDLIDRRNLLRAQVREQRPPYQSLVRDFNERAERHNASCTNLPMLSFDVTAAKENLSCPAP